MTPEHLVISLPIKEIEEFLDERSAEWELIVGPNPYQIGVGFGSRIEALIVMRKIVVNADGRKRQKPIAPIPAKNNNLTGKQPIQRAN